LQAKLKLVTVNMDQVPTLSILDELFPVEVKLKRISLLQICIRMQGI